MFKLINKVKNRKGFTLVELLVVLAVLAIISAIAIPRFAGVQASAKVKADQETILTVQRALELCVTAEGFSTSVATGQELAIFEEGVLKITAPDTGFLSSDSKTFTEKIGQYLKSTTMKLNNKTNVTYKLNTDGTVTH
jgi:prepilin-type N-terminal cleavage/methylation domain-containing protein